MSYLTINGFPLPVVEPLKIDHIPIGSDDRAFSGKFLGEHRGFKRRLSGKTRDLLPDDAKLVRCLLDRNFDTLSFDGALYSGKGIVQSAGAGTYEPWTAADGTRVVGPSSRAYGQALWGTPAATNIFSANVRDVETNTAGFSVVAGGVITCSTERYWHGTHSLKCVCGGADGTQDGFFASAVATGCTGAGQYFCMSVYLTGSGAVDVIFANWTRSRNSSSLNVLLTPDKWTRVELLNTADASTDSLGLQIQEHTINSGITFYADGLSLTKSNTAVPWGDPTTTALTTVALPSSQMVSDEFTILGKIFVHADGTSTYPQSYAFELNASAEQTIYHLLQVYQPNTTLYLAAVHICFGVTTALYAVGISAGVWTPWALAYSPVATATRDKLQLFVGSGTGGNFLHTSPTNVLPASIFQNLYVNCLNNLVDDYMILRTAITQAQYQALTANWDALLPAPQLRCAGDAINAEFQYPDGSGAFMAGVGKVTGESSSCATVNGVWHNDLAKIDFQIDEL